MNTDRERSQAGPHRVVEYSRKPEVAEALRQFRELFVNRDDTYARQREHSRLYYRVRQPLDDQALIRHFQGRITAGLYSIDEHKRTRWSVIDGDAGIEPLLAVQRRLAAADMASYPELSRRGGHLWLFWSHPVDAYAARKILSPYAGDLELYPSGDIPDEGLGLVMRAPFGLHRVNGQRYGFVDHNLEPVQRGAAVRGQIAWLYEHAIRVDPSPYLAMLPADVESSASAVSRLRAGETSPIAEWVSANDVVDVVGHYVRLLPSGRGHCPWGHQHKNNDRHPSFAVYRRTQKWWCFTERVGGNGFDFLCRYHGVDAREMLRRLENKM